ncbi:MAG TPA: arsenical resistance operon transcriptional repressor ArsD [Lachnoclostridium phytofermentans]|uniref:Arsenical resistance operon transcriptional repressor ArsD n=1 Tax=Lachnoclostridium phytofermentans TaxID=66219 RepID=A0A3D2X844_9FIRM|nr:arsenite efflux transporter metallochaperone ArsD [Lachnoclostridium sp.]HCL02715.1 arsenical resistance operon transcriptional repressor ArsD [Lachnoclostridium phytofermentans]
MKIMQIFEPAMCCSTGLCGVGVDPELLRISTVLNSLQKNGVKVDRFNLSNAPQEFITNHVVNKYIQEHGVAGLPVTIVDNEIVITGRYPNNDEFIQLLNIPNNFLNEKSDTANTNSNNDNNESNECGCSGGSCC